MISKNDKNDNKNGRFVVANENGVWHNIFVTTFAFFTLEIILYCSFMPWCSL